MSATPSLDNLRKLWESLFIEAMSEWSGFVEESATFVVVQRGGFMALTYVDQDRDVQLHLNNELPELTMHLVKIRIGEPMRGRGLGSDLYSVAIRFGQSVGMKYVQCFPSGWAARSEHADKSRRQYLVRRGWACVSEDSEEMRIRCL